MKYVVIDLEMNKVDPAADTRGICTQETIEIGAVMLDENLKEIASFRTYVKPEYNDHIMKNISKLTGITTDMVEHAPLFNEAFRMFTNWCLGTGDEVTIYAWSDSDYKQIYKEIALKNYTVSVAELPLIEEEWEDFQHEFDVHLGFDRQLSLKTALDMAGIDFEGRAHDALDDARNTAELFHVFRDEELFDATLRKIKEAMEPTPIGCSLGDMFDFSAFVCA